MTTLQLKQKREGIITQMSAFLQQANTETDATRRAELLGFYDRAEADEKALSELIARNIAHEERMADAVKAEFEKQEQRGNTTTTTAPKSGVSDADYEAAFRSWVMSENEALVSPEVRGILAKRGTSTQVVGTTTLGGYLVPTGYWPMITKALKDYSGIYAAAQILTTGSGNTLYKPTLDDTSTEAVLVAESGALTVQDLTFGQKQLDAYKYASLLKVSWELMQDSEFSIEGEIRSALMPRFGRAINTTCTTGTGSSQPNGVVTASTLGKTAASATAITRPEIVDLVHSVDPAYRTSSSCGFMMHDSVLAALKKLALGSSDATPLWQRSMREGEPDTIEGFRYWINQGMASTLATTNKVMLFGDFSQYVIRIVKNLEMARLNELFAANGQVGFYGFMRWDGECLNTAAIKHYVLA